jgi:SAM-dependent methyltransferase
MFFPEKIKKINNTDRVLEIGPGASPHPRSDVFLEMSWEDELIAKSQRGELSDKLVTDKQIVYYNGGVFPFNDKTFDYVICSHVIEHVPDVEKFVSEIKRVGKRGYMEYPLIYFEFLYNIDVHLNIQKFDFADNCLYYNKKESLMLKHFNPVQKFINHGMKKGMLSELYEYIKKFGVEGFEWDDDFYCKHTNDLSKLCFSDYKHIEKKVPMVVAQNKIIRIKNRFKRFLKLY